MYEDARLEMSHGSQHCLQKAEGSSSGTTGVQKYSSYGQCAQASDGAEAAQAADGAEAAQAADGAGGAQASDGAEAAQASDGAEGAQVLDGIEDMERVRLLITQLSTK